MGVAEGRRSTVWGLLVIGKKVMAEVPITDIIERTRRACCSESKSFKNVASTEETEQHETLKNRRLTFLPSSCLLTSTHRSDLFFSRLFFRDKKKFRHSGSRQLAAAGGRRQTHTRRGIWEILRTQDRGEQLLSGWACLADSQRRSRALGAERTARGPAKPL